MKKVITAIGNPILNINLKKENEIEVITEDIQYQEGILEVLEKYPNVNFLILSELIPGNLEIKILIERIKQLNNNIQIILFLEKENKELENYLYAKGVNFIFYNNQIAIKEIIEIIKTNQRDTNNELKKEIDELKKLLEKKNKKEVKKEIFCVCGANGVGKSIFTINLAKTINKDKILIIDFDILNNSLHTILGVKKYSEKIKNKKNNEINVEEMIIKVNSKLDLLSGINLLFDSKYKISSIKIKNIIDKLKQFYDVIIIDTSSECFFDYTKEIMKLCNLNIFISETNLIEIKKAKRLLNIYINKWEIPIKKINIVFNKYDFNSIDFSILKNIFSDFYILGKLSIDPRYNLIINKNLIGSLDKKLKNEYSEIHRKLLKNI